MQFSIKCGRAIAIGFILGALTSFYHHCNAQDVFLDVSAPVPSNRQILVASYYRNIPEWYYFTVVYMFEKRRFIHYRSVVSFSLDDVGKTHYKLESWIYNVMRGSKVVIASEIQICPIDPNVLPKEIQK